jgi:hypothetical protein
MNCLVLNFFFFIDLLTLRQLGVIFTSRFLIYSVISVGREKYKFVGSFFGPSEADESWNLIINIS